MAASDGGSVESARVPRGFDDRSPYGAAQAIAQTIVEHSDELTSEAQVLDAIVEAQGPGAAHYLDAIARSGHSVFYHQIELLYELGKERVRPDMRDRFCFEAGRSFHSLIYADNITMVLAMALASPHEFQQTFAELVTRQLYFYGGNKYVIEPERAKNEIELSIRYSDPEAMRVYVEHFGLDVDTCFANSIQFIGGTMRDFCAKVIAGFDADRYGVAIDGLCASLRMPVGNVDRFDNDALVPTLVGYVGRLKENQAQERREEILESGLIAESDLMRDTWNRIRRASRSEELVLLHGESGTGKSFLARKIHENSRRGDKPFIEVGLTSDLGSENLILSNLFGHERGAFTGAQDQKAGLFSLADGGTIFLDEIGDAPPELQAKLLRVIETSTFKRLGGVEDICVDVRVIVATNRDLPRMVEEGTFRRDLFYRLHVIALELPPLRDRRDDVPALAEFLVTRAQERRGGVAERMLAPGLADRLRAYSWPGNIRELEHALRHALAMGDTDLITLDDLPDGVRDALRAAPDPGPSSATQGPRSLEGGVLDIEGLRRQIRATNPVDASGSVAHVDFVKRLWLKTLIEECNGDLALIARYWDRSSEKTLRNLVREYGLQAELDRARGRPPKRE